MNNRPPDSTFAVLADTERAPVSPDPGFTARLRRRIEREFVERRGDASIVLPERTPPTRPSDRTVDTSTEPTNTTTESTMTGPTDAATQIITPYIAVDDGTAALDWYRDAFDAIETVRYVGDDGRLGHAEFVVAGARVMLSDAYPEIGVVAANSYEGFSCALHLEVADCDALHARAVELGATSAMAPADQPHGARSATIVDPFGHRWMLSQQITNPTTAEIDGAYDGFTVTEPD